jgi:hypothetical protein
MEQIFGMFTDPNLRPCEPWRRGLPIGEGGIPTPDYSSWDSGSGSGSGMGSGSASPVKSGMESSGVSRLMALGAEEVDGIEEIMEQAQDMGMELEMAIETEMDDEH